MKGWLITLAVFFGTLLAVRVFYAASMNAEVARELREDPGGERAGRVMLLTFADGRELPVNYLREGNQVFAGADGRWWRAFRDGNVPVRVLIRGEIFSGRARTVMDDPEYTRAVFTRLRPKVPKWLPDWLDAYLVVIDLDDG